MKSNRLHLVALVALLLVLSACAPKAVPVPGVAPAAPLAAPVMPAPTPSPEDAAWQKVVEAAKKEGRLVTYEYLLMGDVGLAVTSAFEKTYGIKLEVIIGRGAEFLERLKTEKRIGQMTGDVVSSSASHIINMRNAALTESMLGVLPILQEKDSWVAHPLSGDSSGHGLGFAYASFFPYFNTRLLKTEDVPKSLQDFLNPRWKGKISAVDPVISTSGYSYFVPLLNRGIIDLNYIKALGDQNLVFNFSANAMAEKLARSELPLMLPTSEAATSPFALQGAPMQAFAVDDTTVVDFNLMAAVKDARHPNAARLYLNWRLSREGQEAFAKAAGQAPVRKDVPDYRPPSVKAPAQKVIVVTEKDLDDTARLFREKVFVPLMKR